MKRYKRIMILLLVMSLFLIIPASFASDNLTVAESSEIEADEPAEVPVLEATEDNEVVSGMDVVYVNSENGTDDGAGTEDDPVRTIKQGFDTVNYGGIVYLTGTFKGDGNSNLAIDGFYHSSVTIIGLGDAIIDCENEDKFASVYTVYIGDEYGIVYEYEAHLKIENILFIVNYKNAGADYGGIFDVDAGSTLTLNNCFFKYGMEFSANNTEITAGETAAINITTPTDSAGTCLIEYNGTNYTGDFKDGLATIEIPNLKEGNYEFTVQFLGDDQFAPKNTTAVVKVNRKKLDVVYVNSENGTDDGDGTEDNPLRTIQQGFDTANDNGIIYLTGTFKGEGNSDLYFTQTPNNATFIGLGETVIDGEKSRRIFHIGEEINVTVKNIKFINGHADYGGAIYVNGGCSLIDCIFTNNNAAHNGGAVYWDTNAVGITNCTFENNHAEVAGGANFFFNRVDNVILTGNFTNNTAQYGGANYFWSTVDNVILTGTFSNNHAENGEGGANSFKWGINNVTLTGNFNNNTAKEGGANHFNSVTNVTLTGNFTNNHAERGGGANNFYGVVTNVILTGNFTNNTAINGGSANILNKVTNVTLTGNYINNTGLSVIYILFSDSGNVIRDSIFINNAPINVENGNITAVDNWFGNNVTNYNVKPEVGIDLDNWLFLNGTANPNPVSVADTTDIVFALSRYEDNNVSSYDNSRLIPIKLDITSTLGSANPNIVNLNESTTYTPESVGNGSITASFENVFCTIEIENEKVEPDMSIESNQSYAGENTTITITLPQDAAGNVTVTDADGNNYTQPVKDGAVDIEVPNLNVGLNKLNITYSGDERYLSKTAEYEVQVDKMPTYLLAENIEMYQGDGTQYIVTLIDARERPVAGMGIKVNITGKTYTIITDENGTAVLPINLKASVHPATAFFNGKGDYANATPVSTNVSVMTKVRIDQHKDMTKDYGDADKFTVHAVDKYGKSVGAYAKVKMTIAGKTYTVFTDENGYASLPINLKPGTYDITCEYAGYTVKHKVTVKQVLSATNRQYKKASSYQFTATLKHSNGKAITGKTVTFAFKGKTYTQTTNAKGEATITIKEALNLGTYNIAIRYLDSIITKTITIK